MSISSSYTVVGLKQLNMNSNAFAVGRHLELGEDKSIVRSLSTIEDAEDYVIDLHFALIPSELNLLSFETLKHIIDPQERQKCKNVK
jgi:hypothetical protein